MDSNGTSKTMSSVSDPSFVDLGCCDGESLPDVAVVELMVQGCGDLSVEIEVTNEGGSPPNYTGVTPGSIQVGECGNVGIAIQDLRCVSSESGQWEMDVEIADADGEAAGGKLTGWANSCDPLWLWFTGTLTLPSSITGCCSSPATATASVTEGPQ